MTTQLGKLPLSLGSMNVDLRGRLGVAAPATPTGFPSLDSRLNGGLRAGDVVALSGPPGSGKTALALALAYVAARSRAATVFASAVLEETELMARLVARALHRHHQDAEIGYGAIWAGGAQHDPTARGWVTTAVDTVLRNVGSHLHFYRPSPLASTEALVRGAEQVWGQRDRTVLVVDGVDSFTAHARGQAALSAAINADHRARLLQVVHELRALAQQGAAVVFTHARADLELVSPLVTLALELVPDSQSAPLPTRELMLGQRDVELCVRKNARGAADPILLRALPGAATFEER